ncbi:MAG: 4-hydroxy-3-methylbut-2-enyl diphosphate reductase, partial [Mucinivorans sp.]
MGKNKFKRFQENLTFPHMVQPDFQDYFRCVHPMRGHWNEFFGNEQPIVLELGCGRGEYTVALAQMNPQQNFIGVDIKGARMWRGAKTAQEQGLDNAAFLRCRIEFIDSFFAPGEVSEIWITFPDPQLSKDRASKRMTSSGFLAQYAKMVCPGGVIHLKTDSLHLHEYTKAVLVANGIEPLVCNADIYHSPAFDPRLAIKTTYEQRFLGEGLPITYLSFSLGGKICFVEPDFQADAMPGNLDKTRLRRRTIEIDPHSGFCFGVVHAIEIAEKLLLEEHSASSLGDIVHNRLEMNRLEQMGLRTVSHEHLSTITDSLLIRAHGEPPSTYATAAQLHLKVVDATCPVVAHLQKRVRTAWEKMQQCHGQVVILGKRGHAEIVGLAGQIGLDAIIVESQDEISQIDFTRPIYLLSQTTQSLELFRRVKLLIQERALNPETVTIDDTICRQVSGRTPHLRTFAARFDVILFVCGRKSSNGGALFEVCRQVNSRTYMVEEASEIDPQWMVGCQKIGICGATSTPKWLMEQVKA